MLICFLFTVHPSECFPVIDHILCVDWLPHSISYPRQPGPVQPVSLTVIESTVLSFSWAASILSTYYAALHSPSTLFGLLAIFTSKDNVFVKEPHRNVNA